jgi:hypothetical protein
MSVVMLRICTVCHLSKGELVPATHIATDADGMQWYECTGHGPDDHATAFGDVGRPRVHLETTESFFERHFGKGRS